MRGGAHLPRQGKTGGAKATAEALPSDPKKIRGRAKRYYQGGLDQQILRQAGESRDWGPV